MPELPEVECVRRSLLRSLVGATVVEATLVRRDVLRDTTGARRGTFDPRALLLGATLVEPTRRGKHLALRASDGRVLEVHLGMSGQLLLGGDTRDARSPTHTHARWTLQPAGSREACTLLFRDPRRFGGLWAFDREADLLARRWRDLGPDALTITSEHLIAHGATSTRTLKAALLDQRLLAGVGNIYADEALFLARLNPRTRCDRLRPQHWRALADAIRQILAAAIAAGGSTLRDYTAADGAPGSMQLAHQVYGRGTQPCLRCQREAGVKTLLRAATLAQRTTCWCPRCQPVRPGKPHA